jgi:hypothetical protein
MPSAYLGGQRQARHQSLCWVRVPANGQLDEHHQAVALMFLFEVLVSVWAGLNAALSLNFHILGSRFQFAIVKLGEASCQKKIYMSWVTTFLQ